MNLFSLFRKRKPEADATVDERVITPALLAKHNAEIRHLINGKWAAYLVGKSSNYRHGEAIDRDGTGTWTNESSIKDHVWCNTREEALFAAVQYLAATGITMPEPQPTGVPVKPSEIKMAPPEVTPLPKPEPPHGGGTILADW